MSKEISIIVDNDEQVQKVFDVLHKEGGLSFGYTLRVSEVDSAWGDDE